MGSSDNELELFFHFLNTNKKKKTNKNKNMKNNVKNTWNHDDIEDEGELDEVDIQCAILSSLRTLEQEQDTKQKRPLVPCTLSFPFLPPRKIVSLQVGSSSSLPTCVLCCNVPSHGTLVDIYPCHHVSCEGCLSRYVGEQVNHDARQVACPGPKCGTILGWEFIQRIVPNEVYWRWLMAIEEGSVLNCTVFLTCPLEGCGSQIVNDERGFWIRACTCCRKLFCFRCMSVCHLGMTCNQFKKREAEARSRRTLIIRQREEERREQKRQKWFKENSHMLENDEDMLRIISRIVAQIPDFGNGEEFDIFQHSTFR